MSTATSSNARSGQRQAIVKPLASFVAGAVESVQESFRWVQQKIDESEIFAYEEEPRGPREAASAGGSAALSASDMYSPRSFESLMQNVASSPSPDDSEMPAALRVIRAHQQNRAKLSDKHNVPRQRIGAATERGRSGMGSASNRVGESSKTGASSARQATPATRLIRLTNFITPRRARPASGARVQKTQDTPTAAHGDDAYSA